MERRFSWRKTNCSSVPRVQARFAKGPDESVGFSRGRAGLCKRQPWQYRPLCKPTFATTIISYCNDSPVVDTLPVYTITPFLPGPTSSASILHEEVAQCCGEQQTPTKDSCAPPDEVLFHNETDEAGDSSNEADDADDTVIEISGTSPVGSETECNSLVASETESTLLVSSPKKKRNRARRPKRRASAAALEAAKVATTHQGTKNTVCLFEKASIQVMEPQAKLEADFWTSSAIAKQRPLNFEFFFTLCVFFTVLLLITTVGLVALFAVTPAKLDMATSSLANAFGWSMRAQLME